MARYGLLLALLLSSCTPSSGVNDAATQAIQTYVAGFTATPPSTSTSAPTATETPGPTDTPSPTATATPVILTTTAKAPVYRGPAAQGFEELGELEAGAQVQAQGRFVDWLKVLWDNGGLAAEGFIAASAVSQIPEGVPELAPADVPWVPLSILATAEKPLVKENTADYWAEKIVKSPLLIPGPFRVRVGLVAAANWGEASVQMVAKADDFVWYRSERLELWCSSGQVQLNLLDKHGTEAQPVAFQELYDAKDPATSQDCYLELDFDQFGRNVDVINSAGKRIDTLGLENLADLPGGLFAEGKMQRVSFAVAPHGTVTATTLVFEAPPDGVIP